jgi:hypothetical protein
MVQTLDNRYVTYSRWVGRYLTNRTPDLLLGSTVEAARAFKKATTLLVSEQQAKPLVEE